MAKEMSLFEENRLLRKKLEQAMEIIANQQEAMEILQQKLDKKNALLSERNKKGA